VNGMLKRDARLGTIFGGNLSVVPERRANQKLRRMDVVQLQ
jgi:hypothetical protein